MKRYLYGSKYKMKRIVGMTLGIIGVLIIINVMSTNFYFSWTRFNSDGNSLVHEIRLPLITGSLISINYNALLTRPDLKHLVHTLILYSSINFCSYISNVR